MAATVLAAATSGAVTRVVKLGVKVVAGIVLFLIGLLMMMMSSEEPSAAACTTPAPTSATSAAVATTPTAPASAGPVLGGRYGPEQLANAREVTAAGRAMSLDDQTIAIAVMTAIGESTLRNLERGDAAGPDSRGLFQQRGGGAWGSLTDRMAPRVAATNFFTALLKIEGYQALAPTIAAHRVQHNADPMHYAAYWADATALVAYLTGNPALGGTGDTSSCTSTAQPGGALPGATAGERVVNAALSQLGTPYVFGGGTFDGPTAEPATTHDRAHPNLVGFDCSGLTSFAWWQGAGIKIDAFTDAQAAQSQPLLRAAPATPAELALLQPGDLVLFHTGGEGSATYSHVGIYDGRGNLIHAPRTGKTVEVVKDVFHDSYWRTRIGLIARPIDTTKKG